MNSVYQILTGLALFQLLFISAFLFTSRKGRRLSNNLLAFFFLSLASGLLDYFLLISGFFDQRTQYAFIFNSLVIFHAPLLLLYTQSLTIAHFRLRPIHLLHALPFVIIIFLLIIFYYGQSPERQAYTIESVREGKDIVNIMISVIGLIYILGYLLAVKNRIGKYRKFIKEQFSNIDKINLNWLNFLVNVFLISIVASGIANILRHSQSGLLNEAAIIVSVIGLLVFISMVLFKGLHQNEVFLGAVPKTAADSMENGDNESLRKQLNTYLENEKPYLNSNLTLNDLAGQLKISGRQLSTIINIELGKTFFDLINAYRIEEAKKMIKESEDVKMTISEVMYQVGFNSKSSFNTAFKKYTGLTPSEYKSQKP